MIFAPILPHLVLHRLYCLISTDTCLSTLPPPLRLVYSGVDLTRPAACPVPRRPRHTRLRVLTCREPLAEDVHRMRASATL